MKPESSASAVTTSPIDSPRLLVAAAVVWRGDRLLMTRRPPGGPRGGMWELPGGKLEAGETPEQAVVRELHEELGVGAKVLDRSAVETHEYPDGLRVEIFFLSCSLSSFRFRPGPMVSEIAWRRPADVDLSSVLAADHGFLVRHGARPVGTG